MNNQSHQEDWVTYLTTVSNNYLGSVLVDVGISAVAPIESFSNLLTFVTYFNQPNEDGLTSESEYEKINQIEDEVIGLMTSNNKAIYVGRIKFAGKMFSYFYFETIHNLENKIAELKTKYPDYRFEHSLRDEPNWTAYFEVIFPSEFDMQVIQNGKVIGNLQQHGDLLEKERQVDHWIYFKDSNNREKFLSEIQDLGFEIVEQGKTSFGNSPFSLQLSRVDKVDYESVNEYVMFLWQKAQEFDGEYDGWETFIVSE